MRALRRRSETGATLHAAILGGGVFVTALLPVVWADLSLRRRYLFTPSAGLALLAAVAFARARRSHPRAAITALANATRLPI